MIVGLVALSSGYAETLRSGDTVLVTVHGEPKISGQHAVSASGTITHSLLGAIKASGKTPEQLTEDIVSRLRDGYIHDPKVGVVLVEQKLSKVRIVGEVSQVGDLPFAPREPFDLKTAIGMVGNATLEADLAGVEIKRAGRTMRAPMPASGGMALRDGDIVNVPKLRPLGFFSIAGQVKAPGNFEIPRGRQLTIFAALNMAGGPTPAAKLSKTTVTRVRPGGGTTTQRVDASDRSVSFMVQPGDEIEVKARIF
jgi:polysaccharide export outer membrane protein